MRGAIEPPPETAGDQLLATSDSVAASGTRARQPAAGHGDIVAALGNAGLLQIGKTTVIGLCGCQGSGKSTLARGLQASLRQDQGLQVAILSLDDLYLPSRERERLAREVHPLLRTRGVPGTHDVDLGIEVLQRLVRASSRDKVRIPRFDKALDERSPSVQWEEIQGRPDIVIFEGWCVGAAPQNDPDLIEPINTLERDCDQDGRWRRYVNDQLTGRYQALFGLTNGLLMLRAPSFDVAFEWRRQQEQALRASYGAQEPFDAVRIMSDEELRRFVMHFERLTRHMMAEVPKRADITLQLDAVRQIESIHIR